jgi:hypothetical protein
VLPFELAKFYYGPKAPFPPPDRRYRIAQAYVAHKRRPSHRVDDEYVWKLFQFLRARRVYRDPKNCVENIIEKYRDLWCAFQMRYGRMRAARPVIEAYLLAGADVEAIASRIGASHDAVVWFATAFYDVREQRKHTAYVLTKLIGVASCEPNVTLDPSRLMKLVGFACGPAALDQLLHDEGAVKEVLHVGGVTGWLAHKVQATLHSKLLETVSNLRPEDEGDRKLLVRLLGQTQRDSKQSAESSLTPLERHVEAMLQEFHWAIGPKELPEAVMEFQHTAAELNSEEEMLLISSGGKWRPDDEIKELSIDRLHESRQDTGSSVSKGNRH